MEKPIIALDLDDVLAEHYLALANFMNERYGHSHTPQEYSSQLLSVWNVERPEGERRMWEFNNADVHEAFTIVPGALEGIQHLRDRYDFVVVTARIKRIVEVTRKWIDANFPDTFKEVAFIHPWEGDAKTKADVCQELGASYLIDDTLKHCQAVAKVGITALLFGGFEGKNEELPPGIIRRKDWTEVVEYFDAA